MLTARQHLGKPCATFGVGPLGGVHVWSAEGSTPVTPAQLPLAVPGFVGRLGELAALDELVDGDPSVEGTGTVAAIWGPPGIGKTVLAIGWVTIDVSADPGKLACPGTEIVVVTFPLYDPFTTGCNGGLMIVLLICKCASVAYPTCVPRKIAVFDPVTPGAVAALNWFINKFVLIGVIVSLITGTAVTFSVSAVTVSSRRNSNPSSSQLARRGRLPARLRRRALPSPPLRTPMDPWRRTSPDRRVVPLFPAIKCKSSCDMDSP